MHTKLTLRMEAQLIDQAKLYARQQGKSLSGMVADYFSQLGAPLGVSATAGVGSRPITARLRGALMSNPSAVDTVDAVDEALYRDYLESKHQ